MVMNRCAAPARKTMRLVISQRMARRVKMGGTPTREGGPMGTGERIRAEIERVLGEQVSDVRLRLALGAARMGAWERNLATGEDIWSVQQEALFDLAPGSFRGT